MLFKHNTFYLLIFFTITSIFAHQNFVEATEAGGGEPSERPPSSSSSTTVATTATATESNSTVTAGVSHPVQFAEAGSSERPTLDPLESDNVFAQRIVENKQKLHEMQKELDGREQSVLEDQRKLNEMQKELDVRKKAILEDQRKLNEMKREHDVREEKLKKLNMESEMKRQEWAERRVHQAPRNEDGISQQGIQQHQMASHQQQQGPSFSQWIHQQYPHLIDPQWIHLINPQQISSSSAHQHHHTEQRQSMQFQIPDAGQQTQEGIALKPWQDQMLTNSSVPQLHMPLHFQANAQPGNIQSGGNHQNVPLIDQQMPYSQQQQVQQHQEHQQQNELAHRRQKGKEVTIQGKEVTIQHGHLETAEIMHSPYFQQSQGQHAQNIGMTSEFTHQQQEREVQKQAELLGILHQSSQQEQQRHGEVRTLISPALLDGRNMDSAIDLDSSSDSSSNKGKGKSKEIAPADAPRTKKNKLMRDAMSSSALSPLSSSAIALQSPRSAVSLKSSSKSSLKNISPFPILHVLVKPTVASLQDSEFWVNIISEQRKNAPIGKHRTKGHLAKFELLPGWELKEGEELTVTVNIYGHWKASSTLKGTRKNDTIKEKKIRFSKGKCDIVFPYPGDEEITFHGDDDAIPQQQQQIEAIPAHQVQVLPHEINEIQEQQPVAATEQEDDNSSFVKELEEFLLDENDQASPSAFLTKETG